MGYRRDVNLLWNQSCNPTSGLLTPWPWASHSPGISVFLGFSAYHRRRGPGSPLLCFLLAPGLDDNWIVGECENTHGIQKVGFSLPGRKLGIPHLVQEWTAPEDRWACSQHPGTLTSTRQSPLSLCWEKRSLGRCWVSRLGLSVVWGLQETTQLWAECGTDFWNKPGCSGDWRGRQEGLQVWEAWPTCRPRVGHPARVP